MFDQLLEVAIPLDVAASYFYRLKHAEATPMPGAPAPQQAPAMLQDPSAPGSQVPQDVLAAMTKLVEDEFHSIYAYRAYAEALKDPAHFAIAEQFNDHADQETDHAEFLMRRLSVLGGPLNLPPIQPPPPSTDLQEILQTLVQIEQEGIADWRQLHMMLDESDPTRFTVEQYMQDEQHHLDELQQMMPSVPATPAAPAVPAGPETSVSIQQKVAKLKQAMNSRFITTPGVSHDQSNGPMSQRQRQVFQALQPQKKPTMLPNGKPSPSAAGQMKTAMSFDHYGLDDRTVDRHVVNDPKKLAHLLNNPVQTRQQMHVSIKTASAAWQRQMASGAVTPRDFGLTAVGVMRREGNNPRDTAARVTRAMSSGDPKLQRRTIRDAGYTLPSRTDEAVMLNESYARMRKAADDAMATGAAPEAPIDPENPDMAALFQQEQQGTVQQLQNETQFLRQRSEQLTQQTQQQQQQLEQQAQQQQQSDQQSQQMQLTAQMANQAASQATMASMNAQQQALQSTQLAANMRIALQQHRQALMDLAAQDPAAGIEQQLQAANANAPPPGQQALGQAAPGAMGAPQQLPGDPQQQAQQPQGPQDPAAAQGAPQGPAGQQPPGPQSAPGQSDKKPKESGGTTVTIKQAARMMKAANPYWEGVGNMMKDRLPYGVAGAALGAGSSMAASLGGIEPAQRRVAEAQQHHDTEGTFGSAMDLAQAKARLELRQVAVNHPRASAVSGAIGGFATGMMIGPETHEKLKTIHDMASHIGQNIHERP